MNHHVQVKRKTSNTVTRYEFEANPEEKLAANPCGTIESKGISAAITILETRQEKI